MHSSEPSRRRGCPRTAVPCGRSQGSSGSRSSCHTAWTKLVERTNDNLPEAGRWQTPRGYRCGSRPARRASRCPVRFAQGPRRAYKLKAGGPRARPALQRLIALRSCSSAADLTLRSVPPRTSSEPTRGSAPGQRHSRTRGGAQPRSQSQHNRSQARPRARGGVSGPSAGTPSRPDPLQESHQTGHEARRRLVR
jgi:hypothetical protein